MEQNQYGVNHPRYSKGIRIRDNQGSLTLEQFQATYPEHFKTESFLRDAAILLEQSFNSVGASSLAPKLRQSIEGLKSTLQQESSKIEFGVIDDQGDSLLEEGNEVTDRKDSSHLIVKVRTKITNIDQLLEGALMGKIREVEACLEATSLILMMEGQVRVYEGKVKAAEPALSRNQVELNLLENSKELEGAKQKKKSELEERISKTEENIIGWKSRIAMLSGAKKSIEDAFDVESSDRDLKSAIDELKEVLKVDKESLDFGEILKNELEKPGHPFVVNLHYPDVEERLKKEEEDRRTAELNEEKEAMEAKAKKAALVSASRIAATVTLGVALVTPLAWWIYHSDTKAEVGKPITYTTPALSGKRSLEESKVEIRKLFDFLEKANKLSETADLSLFESAQTREELERAMINNLGTKGAFDIKRGSEKTTIGLSQGYRIGMGLVSDRGVELRITNDRIKESLEKKGNGAHGPKMDLGNLPVGIAYTNSYVCSGNQEFTVVARNAEEDLRSIHTYKVAEFCPKKED